MTDKEARGNCPGDIWASRVVRVVEVRPVFGSNDDLVVVDADTGFGHYVTGGDLTSQRYLEVSGYTRVVSVEKYEQLEAQYLDLRDRVERMVDWIHLRMKKCKELEVTCKTDAGALGAMRETKVLQNVLDALHEEVKGDL